MCVVVPIKRRARPIQRKAGDTFASREKSEIREDQKEQLIAEPAGDIYFLIRFGLNYGYYYNNSILLATAFSNTKSQTRFLSRMRAKTENYSISYFILNRKLYETTTNYGLKTQHIFTINNNHRHFWF